MELREVPKWCCLYGARNEYFGASSEDRNRSEWQMATWCFSGEARDWKDIDLKLVVGGAASGKLEYVRSLGYDNSQLADATLDDRPVLYNLQDLVAASVQSAQETAAASVWDTATSVRDAADASVRDAAASVQGAQDTADASVRDSQTLISLLLEKEIVVCDEVGSGVIPANQIEREIREATGRLCNQLAQYAESVVRLVAGIPTTIKG